MDIKMGVAKYRNEVKMEKDINALFIGNVLISLD